MTATAAPFGLRPAMHGSGGLLRPIRRTIDPAYTTAIYKGAPVLTTAAGPINNAAANSGRIDGVFIGCEYTDVSGKYNVSAYWPGTASCTNIVAWVLEDPNAIFEVQGSSSHTVADIGNGFGVVNPGSGSTQTGVSTCALDTSTTGTGTKQLVVVDVAQSEDNTWGDAFTILRVKLGNSVFAAALTAI
jgi:hypothetical protein